ncbi:hypothetical protein BCN_3942 [Bacillus cereus NC7401]|nr:hypothetical protein BCN_3942 [Bacillus cereus NC7401]
MKFIFSPLICQKVLLSAGISTVPFGVINAPFHNGITVGCWASSGQIPPPALDKSCIIF